MYRSPYDYEWLPSAWDVIDGNYSVSAEEFRRVFERVFLTTQEQKPNKICQISADMEDIFDE